MYEDRKDEKPVPTMIDNHSNDRQMSLVDILRIRRWVGDGCGKGDSFTVLQHSNYKFTRPYQQSDIQ